jgi:outer membrane immunogenic protein
MIKTLFIAGVAALTFPAVASAADALRGPIVSNNFDAWSGGYTGLVAGVGNNGHLGFRWIGGVNAGFNVMFGSNFVAGIEGDLTATTGSGGIGNCVTVPNASPPPANQVICTTTTVENPWDATLRARVGYAYSLHSMVYATAGIAVGTIKATTTGALPPSPGTPVSDNESETRTGWTIGVGVETIMRPHVTARAEFRYTDLGTASFPGNPNPSATSVRYQSGDVLISVEIRR